MIPCLWHYGGRGSWCHEIVEWLTRDCCHVNPFEIGESQHFSNSIVVVKADSVPSIEQLNAELAVIERGVLIICGNEEGTFDTSRLAHPRMKVWLQTPAPHQEAHRYLPWGWTPGNDSDQQVRVFDWSFAGQNTHVRREECIAQLKKMTRGLLAVTDGFSKGLGRNLYWELLASTKVVPCPSGPVTVDSFRVCEALECGAMPLLDGVSPQFGTYLQYWWRVFGQDVPMPMMLDWSGVPQTIERMLEGWEEKAATCQNWWKAKKAEWLRQLAEDLHA